MTRKVRFLTGVLALVVGVLLAVGAIAEDAGAAVGPALLLEERHYLEDGKPGLLYAYAYDANGFLVKKTEFYSDGKVSYWLEYENDAAGRALRETRCDKDGAGIYREYEYDESGNLVRETEYEKDGTPGMTTLYEYDASDNMVRSTMNFSDGRVYRVSEYEYDDAGRPVRYTYSDGKGNVSTLNTYEYALGEDGLVTERTTFDADHNVHRVKQYEYDARGNVILETTYDGKGLLGSTEYVYAS